VVEEKKSCGCGDGGKCGDAIAAPRPDRPGDSPAGKVDWQDFRDHIATADKSGARLWLYPRKVSGSFFRARTWLSWVLLVVMFGGPFVRINGNPLLMINIVDRRFCILGQIFWPQDVAIFAIAMLIFLTGIIIFTTAFGRLWCGWTCPQIVLMEMVFRKIEYAIEGDAHQQKQLDAAPWTGGKVFKKLFKQGVFLALSFVIGNTLLSYIIGSDKLIEIITDDPANHVKGLTFMVLFTLVFYSIFARFREQACTFICPYGRLQSTMLDENTMVVAYDKKRGEKRGRWSGAQTLQSRSSGGLGDCIDCNLCVSVCPTGIDIRNGTQMECVNCAACIDACDGVMDKLKLPRGLVRYGSLNSIERGEKFKFTPRMGIYSVVLTGLIAAFLVLVFTRDAVELTLLRAPGALYQQTQEGVIENIYTFKLVNKTSRDIPVELRLEDSPGKLSVMGGGGLLVPKEQLLTSSLLVGLTPQELQGRHEANLKVAVYSNGKRLYSTKTIFIGPRN
jgi:cytochrome c oxidase accessory protein FixG